MDQQVRLAIDLLKEHGYKVIRKEKVTTITSTMLVDMEVMEMVNAPSESYINQMLAHYLASELPKVWEKKTKKLDYEQQIEYRATIMVVNLREADASSSSHQSEA